MVFHKYDVPGWQNESYIGVMTWKKQYFPDILNVFVHLWVHKLFPAYFSLTFSQCNYVYFSSFVIPGHLAKMSLFDGKIYFWVNICPYWASRVLDNIQGKYGTNQNCFRTRLAQNSNFIRPGLTFCHPGTMRWPGHIWSAWLEIFVNSDKKVLWEREKALKTWREVNFGHWTLKYMCFVTPGHYGCPTGFLQKTFFAEVVLKREFSKLVYLIKGMSQMYHVDSNATFTKFSITPLTLSRHDKLTVFKTLPSRFTMKSVSLKQTLLKMVIYMKNGNQKKQVLSL